MMKGLFRGKSVSDGEWFVGSFVENEGKAYIVNFTEEGHDVWVEVKMDTVGQSIGELDDEGEYVFEGDLLEREGSSIVQWVEWSADEGVWCVVKEFKDGSVGYQLYGEYVELYKDRKKVVVGTIHDERSGY